MCRNDEARPGADEAAPRKEFMSFLSGEVPKQVDADVIKVVRPLGGSVG